MRTFKFYVPGMFSLILLFPLLMYKLTEWGVFEQDHVLEVNWYSPDVSDPYAQQFPPAREYRVINLTGNTSEDSIRIQYAKVLLNEMAVRFDTTRGVRIHFADTAKYESFIDVLDFCSQQSALAYAPYKNDFWVFNKVKNQEEMHFRLGDCMPPL